MNLSISPLVVLLLLTGPASAQSVSFDIESLSSPNASFIDFTPLGGYNLGVTFIPDSSGADLGISGSTIPSLDAFTGTISGTFTVSGFTPSNEQGTVSTTNGVLTISDGLGDTETARLVWNTAFTEFNTGGIAFFDMNMNGGLGQNLSHFTYSGTPNSALQQDFAGITSGTAVISFAS